jgi:hypothetical protein
VRDEAFYLTMAQVLPAVLIALILELRQQMQSYQTVIERGLDLIPDLQLIARTGPEDPASEAMNRVSRARRRRDRYLRIYVAVAIAFLAGEFSSMAAVLVGVDGWFAWLVAPVTIVGLVALSVLAVSVPLENVFSTKP